ncbi:MAG TPA: 30S ribosomal protein S4 [Candidatus Paceibacterota bacterium]
MLQIKSKYKIAKRLGGHLFEQTQTQKFSLSDARFKKQKKQRRGGSDFNRQLLEKQKVRYSYGLSERQLGTYAARAFETENPQRTLHEMLESRLDNVVYRAQFLSTRRAARQAVSHGHITVNGRKVTRPSFSVSPKDVIGIREGSRTSVLFSALQNEKEGEVRQIPKWLSPDYNLLTARISSKPEYVPAEHALDYQTVFEFYSR